MTYKPLNPVATNHIRAGNTQLWDGNDAGGLVPFDADAVITENTFETIGPTGSGATNIWTDMDLIPANAVALIVDIQVNITSDSTSIANMNVYMSQGDLASPTLDANDSRILTVSHDADASGKGANHSVRTTIPLGPTNQDFWLAWSSSSNSNEVVNLNYRGFLTD